MHVNCPNCQCKGLVDTAPLLNKARIVCVRCGTAFDACFVDGAVQTTVVETSAEAALPAEPAQADIDDVPPVPDIDADDVLALPHPTATTTQSNEPAVLDFSAPPQAETAQIGTASAAQTGPTQMAPPAQTSVMPAPEPDALEFDLMHDAGVRASADEHALPLSRALLERQREQDKYSMGVRLLRVSPLWLLVCGFGFILMVVALNGLTSSAEQLNSASSSSLRASVPAGNQASNQSATHNPRPAVNPPAHVEPIAPQETHEAAPPTQTQAGPGTPQPSVAAVPHKGEPVQPAVAPPVAQPSTQPMPTAQPIAPPEAGSRFTLQVGSYDSRAQADERAAQLQHAGFAAQVAAVELPKRGTWYRVQTGLFADRAAAARYGAELRAKGAASDFIIAELAAH